MAISINTNVMSLNAQNNLNQTQNKLNTSMERLSTGLRINSAKDDAAGLAISDRMNSQIKGLDQAVRNANDGISMAQTAEGATQEVVNLLQNMRELAVQGGNETYSDSDRQSMQDEVNQLTEEINRIADTTEFNGSNLLDGSGGTKTFQVGANADQTVELSLQSVKSQDLNLNAYSGLGDLNGGRVVTSGINASALKINDISISAAGGTGSTAANLADVINNKQAETGVTADAYNTYKGNSNGTGVVSDGDLKINSQSIGAAGNMSELADAINRDAAGVEATLNSDGSLSLSNNTGEDITISANNVTAGTLQAKTGMVADEYNGYISLESASGDPIEVAQDGTGQASAFQAWGFNESSGSGDVQGVAVNSQSINAGEVVINGVDIGDVDQSDAASKAVAINEVSDETGVTADANTRYQFGVASGAPTKTTINGTTVSTNKMGNTLASAAQAITDNVAGVTATATAEGDMILASDAGNDITVNSAGIFATSGPGAADSASNYDAISSGSFSDGDTFRGTISLSGDEGTDVRVTSNAAAPGDVATNLDKIGYTEQGGSDEAIGSGLSVETVQNSNNAIKRIDDAINQVDSFRGEMGAIQNRLESTTSNLNNISENLTGARSRILDADVAQETSQMTKYNILQQAGVSILSQANQSPQIALSLLQG